MNSSHITNNVIRLASHPTTTSMLMKDSKVCSQARFYNLHTSSHTPKKLSLNPLVSHLHFSPEYCICISTLDATKSPWKFAWLFLAQLIIFTSKHTTTTIFTLLQRRKWQKITSSIVLPISSTILFFAEKIYHVFVWKLETLGSNIINSDLQNIQVWKNAVCRFFSFPVDHVYPNVTRLLKWLSSFFLFGFDPKENNFSTRVD